MSEQSVAEAAPSAGRAAGQRSFFRNTSFSLLQTAITMALAVLLVPFLLWRLGTEKYGLWLTLQVFSILGLVSLAELGFQGAVVRYLVQFHMAGDRMAFRRLLATAFVLFTAIGVIGSASVIVFAQTAFLDLFAISAAYGADMRLALSVYALGLLIAFPGLVLKAFFAAIQDVATLKAWEALDRILFTVGVMVLLFFTEQLLSMVLLEQAVMVALFAGFAGLARARAGEWFSLDPRLASRRSLSGVTGLSGMVFATSISNQVYVKAPEALIGASLGPVALAHYQIATRLPRVLKSVQGALNAAVLPYVAGIDRSDADFVDAKRRFALLGLRFNYLLFVPIAVFVQIFADDILRLWVGDRFAFLGTFLALYALWQLTSVMVGFGTATLTRTTHYRGLVGWNLALNALFLAALAISLERFGLIAAFLALLVAGTASAALVLVACRAANGFSYREFLARVVAGPILISAAAGIPLFAGAKAIWGMAGLVPGLITVAAAGLGNLVVIYFVVLDKAEQKRVSDLFAILRRTT